MTATRTTSNFPENIQRFSHFPYRGPPCSREEASSRAWPYVVANLAHQAEPEDWTGADTEAPLRILDNYISYTYRRLVMESKVSISQDEGHATFNTGLLNQHGEEIFGYFARNSREDAQPWFFLSWAKESDMRLMQQFPHLPDMAQYVSAPADLVFDMSCSLTLDVDHIIRVNLERFPSNLQNDSMARITLSTAKTLALKRLRRNYKLAIPQWYPTMGQAGAQLLLPLDLDQTGTADLALVVSKLEGGGYRGHTVLTLNMAYSNARLVARPNSDWLRP